MTSLILKQAAIILTPPLLVFSIVLLFRGHDLPGGGFVGGLMASAAFILQVLGYGADHARRRLRVKPHFLMALGLVVAIGSGTLATFWGKPFLTGLWTTFHVAHLTLTIGTPVFFDMGVYLVVLGTTLMIFFNLED